MNVRSRLTGILAAVAVCGIAAHCASGTSSPPANVEQPTISGSGWVGKSLVASPGRWQGARRLRFAYRWQRCDLEGGRCNPIRAAVARTYRLRPVDAGSAIRVRVRASNGSRSVWAASARFGIVAGPPKPAVLFSERFDYPDGLLTNEYAHWNGSDPASVRSFGWEMTSGSLLVRDGAGWTGRPDGLKPDPRSSSGNDSAVFRLHTRAFGFRNVAVAFSLANDGLTTTARTPAVAWDGVHVFLRYQSQYELYYASANRRDDTVVIKKKCRGGPSNGGTYYSLSPSVPYRVPYGGWQRLRATVQNDPDGSVRIQLFVGGRLLVEGIDRGVGCAPIVGPGAVGIRGDNAEFRLDDFTVAPLD